MYRDINNNKMECVVSGCKNPVKHKIRRRYGDWGYHWVCDCCLNFSGEKSPETTMFGITRSWFNIDIPSDVEAKNLQLINA